MSKETHTVLTHDGEQHEFDTWYNLDNFIANYRPTGKKLAKQHNSSSIFSRITRRRGRRKVFDSATDPE